jgi:hypothetical protein
MKSIKPAVLASALIGALLSGVAVADEPKVTVYKSPTCGCCAKWVDHMKENGFDVETVEVKDLRMIKSMAGVTPPLQSCHTARVGGYVIEGHVPASDVKRLLQEHPQVKGLAAPEMPMGAPGMDGPRHDPYDVVTFDGEGHSEVFAHH